VSVASPKAGSLPTVLPQPRPKLQPQPKLQPAWAGQREQYHDGMMLFIRHVVPWVAESRRAGAPSARCHAPARPSESLPAAPWPSCVLPIMLLLGPIVRPMLRPIAWLPAAAWRLGLRALVAGLQMRARGERRRERRRAAPSRGAARLASSLPARSDGRPSASCAAAAALCVQPLPGAWAGPGGAWDLLWTAGPVVLHLARATSAICSSARDSGMCCPGRSPHPRGSGRAVAQCCDAGSRERDRPASRRGIPGHRRGHLRPPPRSPWVSSAALQATPSSAPRPS